MLDIENCEYSKQKENQANSKKNQHFGSDREQKPVLALRTSLEDKRYMGKGYL